MKIRSTRNKRRFPDYFLGKEVPLFVKGVAFLLVIVVVLFIIDTIGVTYKPTVNVDAYNTQHNISPDLYGYSVGSSFKYDDSFVSATKNNAQSLRVMDEYEPGARMLVKVEDGAYKVLASDNKPYDPNKEYLVKIKVQGSNMRVYVDNKEIFNVNDAKFGQGEIGLTSSHNQNTYFDNVVVTDSSGRTILSDYFSSDSGQWDNGDLPSFYSQGDWKIADGKMYHSGRESITLKKAGNHDWRDYTIQAKIKSTANNTFDAGYIGLVVRYNGALNNYRFLWRSPTRQPYESNNPWGIADFDGQLRFAQDSNMQPTMVVNMRDTSPQAAAELVRKMNVQEKRNIKYWELGNEIWAWSDSYIDNKMYAQKIKEFSKAMKAVDPNIKIGASLLLGFSDWDVEVIKRSAPYFDFISFHYYPYNIQSGISDNHILASPYAFGYNYQNNYGQGKGVVENAYDTIKKYAPGNESRIELAVTEYNTGDANQGTDLIYGLTTADLLGQATTKKRVKLMQFHALMNESQWHWGSYTADYRPKPTALAISLYSQHFGDKSLSTSVDNSPTFSVPAKGNVPNLNNVPYLTSYASRSSDDKTLYLAVVNKHSVSDMSTTVKIDNASIGGQAKVYTMNGPSIHSNNNESDQVKITESSISNAGSNFKYNFPAHSVTILELKINKLNKPVRTSPSTPDKDDNKQPNPNQDDQDNNDQDDAWYEEVEQVGGPDGSDSINETKIVAAAGSGGNPHVKSFDSLGNRKQANFFAYDENFRGGSTIAYGDIDGDGQAEIVTGAGAGGGPHIRAFEENGQEIANFFPFHESFRGGINVATGDTDGDGRDEIAVAQASQGEAWIKVYQADQARTVVGEWNAFGSVESGADIAMGDVDGDGKDEVIVGAGYGGGPHVRIYEADGRLKPLSFFAFHPAYRGGLSVAAGDVDGDGKDEIGVAQVGQEEAWTKIYRFNNQHTVVGEWRVYGDIPVGANIALGDIDDDGKAELVAGPGLGGRPMVVMYEVDGEKLPVGFYVFSEEFYGGLDVAVKG
ncbi:MAG: FG-GAP-like repeat-containing protein [Parcubacteria group bacterium]